MKIKVKSSKSTHNLVCDLVASSLKGKGAAVLDAPCGSGALAVMLKKKTGFHNIRTLGLDVMETCPASDVVYQKSDLNQPVPVESSSLDAVACVDGIAHIQNPFSLAKEFRRILKKDGCLVMSSPNLSALRSRWRYFLTGFHNKRKIPLDSDNVDPQHIINALDLPDLIYLLESGGFRIEKILINQIKAAGFIYAPLIPVCWLLSLVAFLTELKREKRWSSRAIKRTIFRMFDPRIMLGEALIIKARPVAKYPEGLSRRTELKSVSRRVDQYA